MISILAGINRWLEQYRGAVTVLLIGTILVCVWAIFWKNNAGRTALTAWLVLP